MKAYNTSKRTIHCMVMLVTLMLFNTGCNNDDTKTPSSPPEVEIISPSANSIFKIDWGGAWPEEERMLIKATGRSEAGLVLVRIRVLDSQGSLVFQRDFFPQAPDWHEYEFQEQFYTETEGEYELIILLVDTEEQQFESEPIPFRFEL